MATSQCIGGDADNYFAGLCEELKERTARLKTPATEQRERDKRRTELLRPIFSPRYRVLFVRDGKERASPFFSRERAYVALQMMKVKYGKRNAIIYVD